MNKKNEKKSYDSVKANEIKKIQITKWKKIKFFLQNFEIYVIRIIYIIQMYI